jgi:hypothetical protein
MGLVSFIYIVGMIVSGGLAYFVCTKNRCSIEQAAVGSSMLGYLIGSIVGIILLHNLR